MDTETLRQKERLKLIEMEKKKREAISSNKKEEKNSTNRRLPNSKTPVNENIINNNINNDVPIEQKKTKRKPKLKQFTEEQPIEEPRNESPLIIESNDVNPSLNSKSPGNLKESLKELHLPPIVPQNLPPIVTQRQRPRSNSIPLANTPHPQPAHHQQQPLKPLANVTNRPKDEVNSKLRRQVSML